MTPDNLLAIASFTPNSLEAPNAWVGHLPFAAWVMQEVSPKIFVELGTHSGNSYFAFCQSVLENGLATKCYAVDTWQGDEHAGQYSEDIFNKVNTHHQEQYAEFSRLLRMTFDDAVGYFADESIELLHIDGLHTYEAVVHDFETWLPKLAPGAVVMFHDTNVREHNFGVWKIWEDLQVRYPNNLEFVHSHGLGVLQINASPNQKKTKILSWLKLNNIEKQRLINYFSALGSQKLNKFELLGLKQHVFNLDQVIANLNLVIQNKDKHVVNLEKNVQDRDIQITSLNNALLERDQRNTDKLAAMVCQLNQVIAEHGGQITSLNNALLERDNQISSLNSKISEYDIYVQQLISSKSWIITKPMRWVSRIIRGDFIAVADPIKKILYSNKSPVLLLQDDKVTNKLQTDGLYIKPSPIKPTHPVAVILPVYRDVEMTKRCIISAMPSLLTIQSARIVAINDASPDKDMQAMLESFAKKWPKRFTVLQNQENLGFVKTVNKGFAYYQQSDVVILNSDVVVPIDWLSRLIDEAYSKSNIATVTPFSNNATICSFPYFLQENSTPFNLDVDMIDAVFKANKLPCVTAPTGVGFCMYIRRACLDEIGYLNEEKFGRGYGEENDLCQRALKKGWLNLLSPNIYADHEGGVSFSTDKQALVDNAMRVIEQLHPNYHLDVQKFIQLDPLKSTRIQRYIQLLSHISTPKVLMITHALGGGISQHLQEINDYYNQRMAHILLTTGDNTDEINITLGIGKYSDRLVFNISKNYADMIKLLKNIGINAVHFHHIINLDLRVLSLPHELNVPHIFTIHDFYYLHGNPTLTDGNGKYRGYYDEQAINSLHQLPDELSVQLLRDNFSNALESAAYVIFPSNSTKEIFTSIYSKMNAVIAPHIETDRDVFKKPTFFKKKNSYNVGALGALCRDKGADLLVQVSLIAEKSSAPIKFKLLGYAYRPLKKIETTGAYLSKNLPDLICQQQLDLIFFPAQWPETYSYTLSYALDSGLPIIAPNIGAFSERLSDRENTLIFDYNLSPEEIFNLIKGFIKNLEDGNLVKAPKYAGDQSLYGFYDSAYVEIVSRKSKEVNNNPIEFTLNELSPYLHFSNKGGKKYSALSLLVGLRMNPSSRCLSSMVPKRLRQIIVKKLNGSSVVSPQDLINSKVKVSHQKKHKNKRRHH